ncbi:hypothetical protein [Levilactobacillus spicheri]|uniref:HTH marR-type domain-containing protein n=2 Tax=Levilactobacillus spicheri TaxID=216463 RepID=A0A0F3RQI5_9LACO|nr:hypothetical protein [Levilactobacillus spicheri]KJW12175.1 hypothetical protein VC81_09775 [Levilactobacillus spicheri]KRL50058.1 hypothetical protein FD37_GL002187 [Levilactobacillus spicheri DSM 15429]GEO65836.1 hypothetical protein LSP04_02550 [Levilactobacillus spicheri]
MLGFVLGKDGNLHAFFEAFKHYGEQLTDGEYALLRELVHLTREPGSTVNMAQKLAISSDELATQLTSLKAYGLIDYWTKPQSSDDARLPALIIR